MYPSRMVQAFGATLNVFTLLLVNMIGYAVGIHGMGRVADGIFLDKEGLTVFFYSFAFLFSGVQASMNRLRHVCLEASYAAFPTEIE